MKRVHGMRWAAGLALALALGMAPAAARADVQNYSMLALPLVASPEAGFGPLQQRVIDREWGPSDDSLYHEVDIPGWKSEGLAMGMSAVLPGTGHLYAGEGSGWFYLLAEAAGWAGRTFSNSRADDREAEAAAFIGDPYDTTSGWSFGRLQVAGVNPAALEALWNADREAFYNALRRDPQYLGGFHGESQATYQTYRDLRSDRDSYLRRARYSEVVLWANHVVAAFDALRAARAHNLPLQNQYRLQLGQRMREGHRELRAALVRRF